jgi:hypothetical protein
MSVEASRKFDKKARRIEKFKQFLTIYLTKADIARTDVIDALDDIDYDLTFDGKDAEGKVGIIDLCTLIELKLDSNEMRRLLYAMLVDLLLRVKHTKEGEAYE